jgi:5-methylcytosine-specific restriction endonuclease McrA
MRRIRGTGTVSFRASDGMWIARVSVGSPRIRKSFSSKDRAVAEKRMADWIAENRPHLAGVDPHGRRGRTGHMAEARLIATHTTAEWEAKKAEQGHRCHYCKRAVELFGMKDHYVPVSRGGSDGIDNLVLACWDCNHAKADMLPDEFMEYAAATDFFDLPQRVTVQNTNGRLLRFTPEQIEFMRLSPDERIQWVHHRKGYP